MPRKNSNTESSERGRFYFYNSTSILQEKEDLTSLGNYVWICVLVNV